MDPIPPQFLVSIFGPGNVLAAVSALRFLTRGDAAVEVTTVLHLPGWSRGEMADMRKVVDDLLVSFDLPPSIAFGQEDIDGFLASSGNVIDEQAIARVRTALGDRRFAKVFYAHNIVGQATDLFLRAYPEAESITFGDALGSVYNKEFHLALATGQSWPFGRVARPDFKPDRALLILPMDQTGDCLDGSDLEVVPLEFVGGLIGQASPRLTELEAIATALSDYGDSPVAILLLENMSDGAFISLEQEVELYREIIRRHIPNDSIVVLKGHPLAKRDVASLLAARLHPTHRSIVIPPNLARYPIEFWGEILRRSSVIGFSYSCVSLRALFGKEVLNPMTEEMLTKYFSASIRPSYRNALMLLQEQQRSLEEWGGKGILWSGRYPERAGDGPSLSGVATSDSTEALLSRGKESGRLGQMEDARRWFEQALANAPEDATILNNLAISFASEGVLDIAFEAVSRAHRLIPGEQTILSNLVALANQLGRHDVVRAVGQLIVSPDPGEVNRRNLSRLQGSWLVHQSRVRVGQNVIFGGGSSLEVVSSRSGGSGCVSIGSDSQIFGAFVLAGPDARIQIGARTQIGSSRLVARESICIGDDVLMAWGVTILDHDAWAYSWTERRAQMEGFRKEMSQMPSGNSPHFAALSAVSSPVRIGDRAWIGFNVIVGKGVSIGEGAVIGAGSVVYEDVPPYSVVAGNPGRVVKLLKPSTISRVGNDAFPGEERPSS